MGVALVVRHLLRPGHADEFDALVARTLADIRALEPGTLVYVSHSVHGDPLQRVFYELYRDRAAFEAHEEHVHVRAFLEERMEHVASVEVTFLDSVAAHTAPASSP